jgi:hypothetical protein
LLRNPRPYRERITAGMRFAIAHPNSVKSELRIPAIRYMKYASLFYKDKDGE